MRFNKFIPPFIEGDGLVSKATVSDKQPLHALVSRLKSLHQIPGLEILRHKALVDITEVLVIALPIYVPSIKFNKGHIHFLASSK